MTVSSAPVGLPDVHLSPGGAFGIYVHVPFCFTRCGYCDFNTYTPAELGGVNPDAYLQVLRSELELAAARLGAPKVQTVFVGGGTPSPRPSYAWPASRLTACRTPRSPRPIS